jgi:two-component system NarL family response regulator
MSRLNPIRILIAEDHPMMRSALISMITGESHMTIVAEAKNGQEAIDLFEQHQPDVTLMDIEMPGVDGLEAITSIMDRVPDARFIVLTNYDTDEDIFRGLDAGAMSYLLKDSSQDRLLKTIRAVHAGQRYVPRHIADKLAQRKTYPKLSAREMAVLELMMRGKSNRAIGIQLGITESTVKSHVKNILIKLRANDRTQAVTKAIQRGILSPNE